MSLIRRGQTSIALSSAEAEFHGGVTASSEGIWFARVLADLGLGNMVPQILVDSSAARGLWQRQGTGSRIRHLDAKSLWVQYALNKKQLTLHAVAGVDNPADIGTKALDRQSFEKHRKAIGLNSGAGETKAVGAIGGGMSGQQAKAVIAAIAVMTQMAATSAERNNEVQIYKAEVCTTASSTGGARWLKEMILAMMIGMFVVLALAALCYKKCSGKPKQNEPKKKQRSIATQAQTTYTMVRGCVTPRFHPLTEYQHGAFLWTPAE